MTLLVDADIVAYRCAASAENDPLDVALVRVDVMMRDLLDKDDSYLCFLSGPKETNFRYTINPDYKANRIGVPKPKWLAACKDFLINEYHATITHGCEADDFLGIHQTADTVICSIDKDLLMIPGAHFNFVTQKFSEVSELDGLKQFYRQMLIGDTSDNIFGIKGIGKVKAGKLIDPIETEEELFSIVWQLYAQTAFSEGERFWMNADCLWIWRKHGETYSKIKGVDREPNKELYNQHPQSGVETLASEV
jgi:5'-3' exonuclease